MATQTITGTPGNDSYRLVSGVTAILNGLGGTDSLDLGTSLRSAYSITLATDGSVQLDSLTTASGGTPAHLTLVNMEILTFNSGRDTVDLLTYFGKSILGTNANDILQSTSVNETIDGGAGTDTAVFNATRAASNVSKTSTGWTLTSTADGTDTLTNIERLKFSDGGRALDLGTTQSGGQTALLLGAVLPGKLALDTSKQALMGAVIDLFDQGYSLSILAGALLRLDIWSILTGQSVATTSPYTPRTLAEDTAIANYLLTNVNGAAPDATTLQTAADALHNETSQGAWLAQLAASTAGQVHIGLTGLANTGLDYS
jgi:hypothetical protein